MTRITPLLVVALGSLLALTSISRAAPGDLDAAFVSNIGAGITPAAYPTFDGNTGAVNAVALQSTGKILAGGNLSKYNNTGDLSVLKRLNADGTLDSSFNIGGAGFADSQGNPEVKAILVLPDDSIIIGGVFTSYNGISYNGIIKLQPNGAVDTTFTATGLNTGLANRYVSALLLLPDGGILLGGDFTSVNGTSRIDLAKLSATGVLDTTFVNNSLGSSNIADFAITPDGRIYLSGTSITANGSLVRRLFPSGTTDASFQPQFGPGNGGIGAILLLPNGTLLAGGFPMLASAGYNDYLVAIKEDATLDTTFMANMGTGPNGFSGYDMTLGPDGKIILGSRFLSFNGQLRPAIVRLFADGTPDTTFAPLPYTTTGFLTHFYSVLVQPDGKILGGGWFDRVSNPALETFNLTRFEGDSTTPGPGTFRLSATKASIAEGGSLQLRVFRFGGSTGAVSVNYATSNGTASSGSDYTAASGTLNWAAGDSAPKIITIPTLQDLSNEGDETLSLTLSGPTGGATIQAGSGSTTVTILDDDNLPTITSQPAGLSVYISLSATFTVRATHALPITFQWYKDGSPISGATNFTYTRSNLTTTDGGNYTVRVSIYDPQTSATRFIESDPALLTIVQPPGSFDPDFNLTGTGFNNSVRDIHHMADGSMIVVGDFSQFNGTTTPIPSIARLNADGTLNTSWPTSGSGSGPNAAVYDVTPYPTGLGHDGKFLVSGAFTTYNGSTRNRVARLNADGTLDTTFSIATSNSTAQRAVIQSTGNIVVGFAQNGVIRYNSTGTQLAVFQPYGTGSGGTQCLDLLILPDGKLLLPVYKASNPRTASVYRFNSDFTQDPAFYVQDFDGQLFSIVRDSQERIYVGGNSVLVNGQSYPRLARLLPNGQLDTTYTPAVVDSQVYYLYMQPDDRLVVGGMFANVGSLLQRGLTRLLPTGERDVTFFTGDGVNSNAAVNVIAPDAQGRLFIGGSFTSFSGSTTRRYLTRLKGDFGTVQFSAPTIAVNEQAGTVTVTVQRLVGARGIVSVNYAITGGTATAGVDYTGSSSGTLTWADGETASKQLVYTLTNDAFSEGEESFTLTLSSPTNLSTLGQYASTTVTIVDDESLATITAHPQPITTAEGNAVTFSVGIRSATTATYQWLKGGSPISGATSSTYTIPAVAIADAASYSVRVTNSAGPITSTAAALTVLTSPTGVHATWTPPTSPPTAILNGTVRAILPLPDGGALVGGDFTNPQRGLVRLTASGAYDSSFTLALGNVSGFGVHDIVKDALGRIYIVGRFDVIGSKSYRNFVRLRADFTVDDDFAAVLGSGPDSLVRCVSVFTDGRIYIGGSFGSVSSTPATRGIARIEDYGDLDRNFVSFMSSSGEVYRIRQAPGDTKIYMAGTFTSYLSANYMIRLNADGSRDNTFNLSPSISGSPIRDFTFTPDGRLLIGGDFTSPRAYLSRITTSGVLEPTFLNGGAGTGSVSAIHLQQNGKILIGGSFTNFNGTHNRFSRILADGTVDGTLNLGTGFGGEVNRIVTAPDGRIWVGGSFTTFKGATANYLTRLYGDDATIGIRQQPLPRNILLGQPAQLSVTAVGTGTPSYQWFKNGVALANTANVTGVTTATLNIANTQAADEGTYSVRVSSGSVEVLSDAVPLQIVGAPVIVDGSEGGSAPAGRRFLMGFLFKAAEPYTIQWYKGGSLISGATSSIFVLPSPTTADNGTYEGIITNTAGSASTGPLAVDFVSPAPAGIFASPLSSVFGNNSSVIFPIPDGRFFLGYGQTTLRLYNSAGVQTTIPAFNNSVSWIIRQKDGGYLIGGAFTQADSTTAKHLARLRPDFTLDTTFQANLGTFNLAAGTNASVTRILELPNGRIVVAGTFMDLNGAASTRGIVMLYPDGTRDTTFNSAYAATTISVTTGLAYDAANDSILWSGQSGIAYSGVTSHIHRLRRNGTRLPGMTVTLDNSLRTMVMGPDRRILIGGDFTNVQGIPRPGLARLNSDGTFDTSFIGQSGFVSGSGIGSVKTIALEPDGQILIGGDFTSINSTGAHRIARLNGDGRLDDLFDTGMGFEGNGVRIESIAVAADGKIYVTGSVATYDGTTINDVVILNGDAVPLAFASVPDNNQYISPGQTLTLSALGVGTSTVSYKWYFEGAPLSDGAGVSGSSTATLSITGVNASRSGRYTVRITNLSGFREYDSQVTVLGAPLITEDPVGGSFFVGTTVTLSAKAVGTATLSYQWYNGGDIVPGATAATLSLTNVQKTQSGSYTLRVTNTAGSATSLPAVLNIFLAPAGFKSSFPITAGASSDIKAIVPLGDGRAILGGSFTTAGATGTNTSAPYLTLMNADGTIDTSFAPAANSQINVLARTSSGSIYAAGFFSSIGGVTRSNFVRLNANGTADTTYLATMGSGPNSSVNAIIPLPNGKVLLGGNFNSFSGTTRYGLVQLNADGSRDTDFNPPMSTFGSVQSMALQPDGKIVISGNFTISGRQNLARLNADGTLDTSFSAVLGQTAASLAIQPDGRIIVGGMFTSYNSTTVGNLIRISTTGALEPAFPAGGSITSGITTLLVQPNGRILIGGYFNSYAGSGLGLARLEPDGNLDAIFVTGTGWASNATSSLALEADGTIWAGSNNLTFNGQTVNRLVVFNGDEPVLEPTFAQWITTTGVPSGQQGPNDDPDNDGISNLLEYALGLNPGTANPGAMPTGVSNPPNLTLTYKRARSNVTYSVVTTDDLTNSASWTTVGVTQGTPDGAGITTASVPMTGPPRRFLMLRVTQ